MYVRLQDLPALPSRPPIALGSGTFGYAEAAYTPALGEFVVKSPTASVTAADMDEEAKYLSTFRHPNIVQYFGRFQHNVVGAIPGIVLERLSMDLSDYLPW